MLHSFLKLIVTFSVSLKNKSKMAAISCLIGSKSIIISIWDTFKLFKSIDYQSGVEHIFF